MPLALDSMLRSQQVPMVMKGLLQFLILTAGAGAQSTNVKHSSQDQAGSVARAVMDTMIVPVGVTSASPHAD